MPVALRTDRRVLGPGERERAPDGTEYALCARAVAVNPLDQTITREIRAQKWCVSRLLAEETHTLSTRC